MFWKKNKKSLLYAVISEKDAKITPYLIVFVEKDGKVRELHDSEKKYLETPFYPSDGSRPYIKNSYSSKNGWGEINGYCYRSKIPSNIEIHPSPAEDPTNIDFDVIKFINEHGIQHSEEDGKLVLRRKKKN